MRLKKTIVVLIMLGLLFPLFSCRSSRGINSGLLKEETGIFEAGICKIQNTFKKFKNAELNNQLQNQLDFKRELNSMILGMNKALKECSGEQKSEKTIPFSQIGNSGNFSVSEVKLVGCHFNEEIMDLQVQLAAIVKSKENKNDFLRGELLDSSGMVLKEIQFYMTSDYPEKGKTALLLAHVEGCKLLKSIYTIRFK